MLFCFVGGGVTVTAYIESYVDQTNVIWSIHKPTLVFVLWVSITIGRIVGVIDQRYLTRGTLYIHLSLLCLGGFCSMMLITLAPRNSAALWIGTCCYGLFHGPTVGFSYDLNNRLTLPTERSMSIVMFGLNLGASVVPFLTTQLWKYNQGNPLSLIIIVGLSSILPFPLLYLTSSLTYISNMSSSCSDFDKYRTDSFHDYHVVSEKDSPREVYTTIDEKFSPISDCIIEEEVL
jgi:fucose permease